MLTVENKQVPLGADCVKMQLVLLAAEICPHISCLALLQIFRCLCLPRYKIERLNQSETNRQDNS